MIVRPAVVELDLFIFSLKRALRVVDLILPVWFCDTKIHLISGGHGCPNCDTKDTLRTSAYDTVTFRRAGCIPASRTKAAVEQRHHFAMVLMCTSAGCKLANTIQSTLWCSYVIFLFPRPSAGQQYVHEERGPSTAAAASSCTYCIAILSQGYRVAPREGCPDHVIVA